MIALGDHATWTGSGAGTHTSSSRTTGATGSAFFIFVSVESAALSGVSDSKGNTYTQLPSPPSAFGNTLFAFYCENAVGGASHTFSVTTTAGFPSAWMVEVTGGATAGIIDQSNKLADAATPFQSGGITTTQAAEMLLACCAGDGSANPVTYTHGNSFTQIDAISDGGSFWTGATSQRIVAGTGTYDTSVTINNGANVMTWLLGLKEAVGGGGAVKRNNLALMGVGR